MAKKEELFWLGEGVININGKDYGAEKPLPVDEINTPDLKKMKKDGRVGAKISTVVVDGRDNRIAELESELAGMVTAAKAGGDKIAGLELDLEAATEGMVLYPGGEKVTFDYLRDECTRLTAEVKEAADLKAVHVQAHADAAKEPAKSEKKDGKK